MQVREDTLEEEMATHSSILAWEIPRMEEPGGLLSMGGHKGVGPYLATQAATFFTTFYLSLTYLLPQNPQLKKERKESAGY